jgi:plastocyanin
MEGKRTRFVIALMLAASLLLVSAGFAEATAVIKATSNRHWNPATTSISRGTKVVWKNPTGVTHTVSSYGSNWSKDVRIHPGNSTSFTFNNSGTFKFRCKIHSTLSNGVCSGMCGVVKVS